MESKEGRNVVADFRALTDTLFNPVAGMSASDVESFVEVYTMGALDKYDVEAEVIASAVTGSRSRGLEREDSDLDVVIELRTAANEDYLFDILHEEGIEIGGVKLDINPITEQKTGTLEEYLVRAEEYLAEMRDSIKRKNRCIFSVRMNDEERCFVAPGGSDTDGICRAYSKCEKPFVEMEQYGKEISVAEFAEIQQSDEFLWSVEFNADTDEINICDGGCFWRRRLSDEMYKIELADGVVRIKIQYLDDSIERLRYIDGKSDWIDLRSAEDVELHEGEYRLISLGVAMKLPKGYEAHIVPRSSTFKNFGVIQANSMGIIDNTYCGPNDWWHMPVVALRNTTIHKNDRICQFRIIMNQPEVIFEEVEKLGGEDRGGLGSTGVQ